MQKGIAFALAACFIWGLIFVIPGWMDQFSPLEIAMGRFTVFATLSVCIMLKAKIRAPLSIWIKGAYFSFAATFGYYIFLILGLRYASPQITALIVGISPILICFWGNFREKQTSFKSLIIPSLLILIGLAIINVPQISDNPAASTYLLGLACCFCALVSWSWFVIANSEFLKKNPNVASSSWSTIIGVATLFWVLLFGTLAAMFFPEHFDIQKYATFDTALVKYIAGSVVLGVFCSWLGGYLWNKASLHLPVSLAGQLTIFETIFGIIYVYALAREMPPTSEVVGVLILFAAILYGIRTSAQTAPQH